LSYTAEKKIPRLGYTTVDENSPGKCLKKCKNNAPIQNGIITYG
jgi:hypothetical protein